MGAASPGQHGVLEGGEMELGGIAFFPHALPTLGVEISAISVDIWVTTKKPARHEDRRAGWDVKSILESPVLEGPSLHGHCDRSQHTYSRRTTGFCLRTELRGVQALTLLHEAVHSAERP